MGRYCMNITKTKVVFHSEDALLDKLFSEAERQLLDNVKDFAGHKVLIEGGVYRKIWLETQPMGGEMYAGRDMEAALSNTLLFMEHQREDGRLPGSIKLEDGKLVPEFNKFQGFCFPWPALNLYYWMGKDDAYLLRLKKCLERFDAYLWRVRDSNGDGCLETWCQCDTGEDHARRYGDAPFLWEHETPPTDASVVPIASMDIMGFSYAARNTLAKISTILRDGEAAMWVAQAKAVQQKIIDYLWVDEKGACFDRDKHGALLPTLIHNNLRLMYWEAMTQPMAERFVREHLLNEKEFWTPMPLPSVSVSDPLFYNNPENDWSGQPEGLTYQRAIFALENYGMEHLLAPLADKLFAAIGMRCHFTQQFDPFTGAPQGDMGGYGPTMLAVLGYIERLHGISLHGDTLRFGIRGGKESEYTLQWGDRTFSLQCDGQKAVATVDGKEAFRSDAGVCVVTDMQGHVLRKILL